MQKYSENIFSTEGFVQLHRKIKSLDGELGKTSRNKNGHSVNVTYFLPENSQAENSEVK